MIKRLFIGFFVVLAPMSMALAVTGRPSMARAPTMSISAGVMTGGTISGVSASSATDSRCSNTLPDQITTSRCIQKYMACLKMDTVCGAHFESCDSVNRFNQKRILCNEKLLECPDDGITSIYGITVRSAVTKANCDGEAKVVQRTFTAPSGGLGNLTFTYLAGNPVQPNQIAQAIYDGADWVAANAATGCMNVANGCIKRACQTTPFKCLDNATLDAATLATISTHSGANLALTTQYSTNMAYDAAQVTAYIDGACQHDIGTNRACYIFVNGTVPTTDAWTVDNFENTLVYQGVRDGGAAGVSLLALNRNDILKWAGSAVSTAVSTCKTATSDCVKNVCGSGSIAACYGAAHDAATGMHIENVAGITPQCSGIIDKNQTCRDLLVAKADTATSIWNTVWGTIADWTGSFGLVGELNTQLAQMFNDTMVRNLFTQCRSETESCIRRECGTNFTSCYINDKNLSSTSALAANANYGQSVISGMGTTSATENAAGGFDMSMARSLCLIPVKKSNSCQDYFDIEYARNATVANPYSSAGSWGSMSGSFGGAGAGWSTSTTTAAGTTTQSCSSLRNYFTDVVCDTATPPNCTTTSSTGSAAATACAAQESSIFDELMSDIAQTARAQLTKEQNALKTACENHRGQSSLGDTYMWAEKPDDADLERYDTMGIATGTGNVYTPTSMVATANLWGSFCQVKVAIKSSDPKVQALLQGGAATTRASAYFSLGDSVMCGSWLQQSDLDAIEASIRSDAQATAEGKRGWWESDGLFGMSKGGTLVSALGMVGGGIGGGLLMNNLANKSGSEEDTKKKAPAVDPAAITKLKESLDKCQKLFNDNIEAIWTEASSRPDKVVYYTLSTSATDACKVEKPKGFAGANSITVFPVKIDTGDPKAPASKSINLATIESKEAIDYKHKGTDEVDFVAKDGIGAQLEAMQQALKEYNPENQKDGGNAWKDWGATTVGAIGGAAVGLGAGLLTDSITKRSRELKELQAQDDAVKAWFDNVGSKIQCTVGGKVIGAYGDLIELK